MSCLAADEGLGEKRMKTYLYVTPFFPKPGDWRGSYGYDFVRAVKASGRYRVEVFVEGAEAVDYEVGGIRVHEFPAKYLPSNILPFFWRRRNVKSFLAAVRRAGVDAGDVAVCHGNTANYAIYALAAKSEFPRCRSILHHHDLFSFGLRNGILRHCWFYNLLMFTVFRRLHERIDLHVFISERSRRSFLDAPDTGWTDYALYKKQMRYLPYRPAKIKESVVLHNGVDRSLFVSDGRTAHEGFVIGCIGNFVELKDQITLLKAVAASWSSELELEYGKIKVVFIGSGEKRAECERYAKEHGIDAEFRDEVRHECLPDYYRGLDLFVLPSFFEGFGCVYTEAWCCGTPFIACEGQGIEDVIPVEDRGKWLCRPRDPDDLAAKITAYAKNRREQRLTEDCDINTLVGDFLDRLEDHEV